MALLSLQEKESSNRFALFDIGFRALFFSAALYSLVAMGLWCLLYYFGWQTPALPIDPVIWHAHEMIFGYSLAVIAGFLLTAVQNWTGQETLKGRSLLALLLLWLLARVSFWLPSLVPVIMIAVFDSLFVLYLIVAIAIPIIRIKQWRQLPIITILVMFLVFNITFYTGLIRALPNSIHIGLYGGFYLTLLLMLIISRRVFPMFIARGVADLQPDVTLKNRTWIDISVIILFLVFMLLEIFTTEDTLVGTLALALALLTSIRLAGWYCVAIWQRPLLWVLFVSHIWIITGFFILAASAVFKVSPLLALHAFSVGGVGMLTLGMMSRVSIGHTGRNVTHPPFNLNPLFVGITASAIIRVLFPLMWPHQYLLWVGLSQALWMFTFALFLWHYTSILMQPREN